MKRIDLTGQRFSRWLVLGYSHTKWYKRGCHIYWKCKCGCRTIKSIYGTTLRNGSSKSCGCYHNDLRRLEKGEAAFHKVYQKYRSSAKKRKLIFTLSIDEFKFLTKQNCYYCGVEPVNVGSSDKRTYGTYTYNGVDRVDSTKGYEIDNVVACCSVCNFAKGRNTIEQFMEWVDRITKFRVKTKK